MGKKITSNKYNFFFKLLQIFNSFWLKFQQLCVYVSSSMKCWFWNLGYITRYFWRQKQESIKYKPQKHTHIGNLDVFQTKHRSLREGETVHQIKFGGVQWEEWLYR